MKELSTEQKAQRYNEALERAKGVIEQNPLMEYLKKGIEYIFPELKESEDEDEKIRKWCVNLIKTTCDYDSPTSRKEVDDAIAWLEKQVPVDEDEIVKGIRRGVAISLMNHIDANSKGMCLSNMECEDIENAIVNEDWDKVYGYMKKKLEKQGEQKPVDKVESKFHEGDWIIHQGTENVYQVVAVIDNQYQLKYGDNYTVQKCADVDRCARLYDVTKDAKDGDVLEYQGEIFIIRELKKKVIASRTIEYYCCYDGEHFINNSIYSLMDDDLVNIHPSTHKQHNLLLQKMHEAGYEWDDEKKELKKIEQKPAEWSEDNLPEFESYLCLMFQKFRTKGICTNGEIIDYVNEHSQKLKDILCHAWSEEDNKNLEKTVWYVEEGGKLIFQKTDKLMSWLKSLKPQNTWKPSDEQVRRLEYFLKLWGKTDDTEYTKVFETVKLLLNDLKKLKEE